MNIYVGNLPSEVTEEHLRTLFSEFGPVVSVKIIKDNVTGQPRGFGFVEMTDKYQSYDAINNIDGTYFMGNIISAKEAKGKTETRRPGGYGNSGGGYGNSGGGYGNSGGGYGNSGGNYGNSGNSGNSGGYGQTRKPYDNNRFS